MRVLFINPPWINRKDSVWHNIASIMPPLGLAWMAAVLERDGHEVCIVDAHAERLTLDNLQAHLGELGNFDLVGITATTALITNAIEIAKMTKTQFPQAMVILGGVHPTVLPDETLAEPAVDVVVRGEGEQTICQIAAKEPLEKIGGISFKVGQVVHHNPDQVLIKDLDSLPMPAYHLLPMNKYHPAVGAAKRRPAVSILATRGCPGRCTFCYRIFGKRLRVRSGRKVAKEAKFLQDNYGIKEICFYDDTFTANKKEVYAFCEALDEFKMDLTWSCFSRTDTVNEELLRRIKEAGCHQIMYGIESANAEILRNIGKRVDLKKAEYAVRISQEAGLDVRAAFMIGNPGETEQTMEDMLAFAIKLNPELIILNIATPFPGTEMFKWADEKGYIVTKNWAEYDFANSIMELPTISREKLQKFYRKAYIRFFLRPSYIINRIGKLRSLADIANAFRALRAVIGI
ncbi:MAG: cobalamin-dependent protein [Phycisphaerae bacterium]|nr:cobalamin-dependent protein [Phycisphaerae bacterium]